nr:AlNc14C34G3071 [Albugo laibachii Nc14]|eukprot:CCA17396.1 AlNc14C34G3071 [Albugo laibachii Nc14]
MVRDLRRILHIFHKENMQTPRTQRSVQTSGTSSTMKRVGGGYVIRTAIVEPNQQQQHQRAPTTGTNFMHVGISDI